MPFGLSDNTIDTVRRLLRSCPQLEKAVLYGSRAKGNYKEGSDIDLTLIGALLDYTALANLTEAFAESSLPYTVDLSLFDKIENKDLRDHIERVGVVLYERAEQGTGR